MAARRPPRLSPADELLHGLRAARERPAPVPPRIPAALFSERQQRQQAAQPGAGQVDALFHGEGEKPGCLARLQFRAREDAPDPVDSLGEHGHPAAKQRAGDELGERRVGKSLPQKRGGGGVFDALLDGENDAARRVSDPGAQDRARRQVEVGKGGKHAAADADGPLARVQPLEDRQQDRLPGPQPHRGPGRDLDAARRRLPGVMAVPPPRGAARRAYFASGASAAAVSAVSAVPVSGTFSRLRWMSSWTFAALPVRPRR